MASTRKWAVAVFSGTSPVPEKVCYIHRQFAEQSLTSHHSGNHYTRINANSRLSDLGLRYCKVGPFRGIANKQPCDPRAEPFADVRHLQQ